MSREIKFRAKRLDNNQWVIGYYLPTQYGEKHFIYFALEFLNEHTRIEIDPKTLGQFTGLKDKNGKEIYEGDVVFSESNQYYKQDEIVWDCYEMGWDIGKKDSWKLRSPMSSKTEIIGNIYENPELITEVKNG